MIRYNLPLRVGRLFKKYIQDTDKKISVVNAEEILIKENSKEVKVICKRATDQ